MTDPKARNICNQIAQSDFLLEGAETIYRGASMTLWGV
jgi:hypothetical protein